MFGLFDENAELTSQGRKLTWTLVILYIIALILLCWTPQPFLVEGVTTPNIFKVGRLVFLLVPFNSLISLEQLNSPKEVIWVIGQNITNIFLIFPLVLGLLTLYPSFREKKKVVLYSFAISLVIECGQLLLDYLIVANRVFEIDDLITNTLGGYLAFLVYKTVIKKS